MPDRADLAGSAGVAHLHARRQAYDIGKRHRVARGDFLRVDDGDRLRGLERRLRQPGCGDDDRLADARGAELDVVVVVRAVPATVTSATSARKPGLSISTMYSPAGSAGDGERAGGVARGAAADGAVLAPDAHVGGGYGAAVRRR